MVTVKLKGKWKFSHRQHVVLYSIHKKYLIKVTYFSNIYYHTQFLDLIISATSVASTSQVHASAMFLFLTADIKKYTPNNAAE
jgi:thiosulfate reductase cytochrome b subunit